jgi:hypothetical protein
MAVLVSGYFDVMCSRTKKHNCKSMNFSLVVWY